MTTDASRHVVFMSDKVWKDAKMQALTQDVTVSEYVEGSIKERVQRDKQKAGVENTLKKK